jgi:hypothetical protein
MTCNCGPWSNWETVGSCTEVYGTGECSGELIVECAVITQSPSGSIVQRRTRTCTTATSYTITWNPNGGIWSTSPTTGNRTTTVNDGTVPTQPAALSRTGFTFSGWSPAIVSATQNTTYTAE